MKIILKSFLVLIAIALLGNGVYAKETKEIRKSFDKKERVRIDLVMGSCKIEKSKDDKIHVYVKYTFDPDIYEVDMYESSNTLDLEEKFDERNPRGESFWEIMVPDDLKIDFQSSTGSFTMLDVKVDLEGNSGTGNLDVENCSGIFDMKSGTGTVTIKSSNGEFKLNSGTGNVISVSCGGDFDMNSGTGSVKLKDVNGEFNLNSGIGDVEADGIKISKRSKFNSGTGDVYIVLNDNPAEDIEINSGTGSAELNMNGLPLKGLYVFKTKAEEGRIICPINFDKEEEYWRNGELYEIKSFVKGTDSPEIKISSGTGTTELSLK